jgi:hypothetical protein
MHLSNPFPGIEQELLEECLVRIAGHPDCLPGDGAKAGVAIFAAVARRTVRWSGEDRLPPVNEAPMSERALVCVDKHSETSADRVSMTSEDL